jgi:hypothetical protein
MVGTWSFDASANVLAVVGGTSGFIDAWNNDQANGWNVVHKQGDGQFLLDCKLQIGDGSTATYFADTNKQVAFSAGTITANSQYYIDAKANATVTLGALMDASTKRTSNGVDFAFAENTYYGIGIAPRASAVVNLYSCSFRTSGSKEVYFQGTSVYNCVGDGLTYFYGANDLASDVNNYICSSKTASALGTGLRRPRAGSTFNNIFILHNRNGVWFQTVGGTVKNVYANGGQYLIAMQDVTSSDAYAINVDWAGATWAINWAGTSTKRLYRQYEFDIAITDKENNPLLGASVELKDKDSNAVFSVTMDANGAIATQTVSRGFYQQSTGSTLQEYSPHTLTVTKAGYQNYVKKHTFAEKTKWAIKLARAQMVLLDVGKPVLNLGASDPENAQVMRF